MNTFNKVLTHAEPIASGQDLLGMVGQFEYAVVIERSAVRVVRADEVSSLDKVTELRAFDGTSELYIVRVGDAFRGRIRTDGAGEETDCYEETQLLWGRSTGCRDGVTRLHDDRGIDLDVPVSTDKGDRIMLTVRSYLDGERLSFTDWRICGMTAGRAGAYNG